MRLLKYPSFCFALMLSQLVLADDNRKHYYTDIPGIEANVLIKTTTSWNGAKLPPYGEGQPEITIIRYRFGPGASIPMHMHPVINAGVLLKGELNIFTKTGEKITLKAGEPLVELFKEWHYGSNPGSEPVDLIVVYAGMVGAPLTIREK
ncbi:MAG: cupin [Polynucleobacter sp. 24-46-87]|jgi:quercetin dioxygenase-like cupin family protein|uniref:cupin domain-containing protein n=1 Tax=unclassified Polynucleobacter TaxID=2640945 RepID=UPI000BD73FB1|nr:MULTISPECIES: cupin domain-containing protein [unclassified Polynucleobacter]OYY13525.1 MAG: cupin [Polynucleobacter sp. 35-46-11]OZA13568.1 MAG: cupin [Polynucleobacter sp. 24-46-87]OZA75547.1 MAG: cupin [Polynucleobacter sp. 39-46-10]